MYSSLRWRKARWRGQQEKGRDKRGTYLGGAVLSSTLRRGELPTALALLGHVGVGAFTLAHVVGRVLLDGGVLLAGRVNGGINGSRRLLAGAGSEQVLS